MARHHRIFFGVCAAWAPLLSFGAAAALAAEDAAGHAEAPPNPANFQIAPFIATFILFGIVLWILNKYAWPPIVKGLQSREDKIRKEIEDAERSRKQAQSALEQYEQALSQARAEAQKILESAKDQQLKLTAEMKSQTQRDIVAMRDQAARDIDSAKKAAIAEIYGQMAETATDVAGRILQREINPDDQRRLVEESLNQLQAAAAN